jgi:hypothetical protein
VTGTVQHLGDAMKDDATRRTLVQEVVEEFGNEWSKFDQAGLSRQDHIDLIIDLGGLR